MSGLHLALLFGSIQLPPACVPETLQFTCGPATRIASLSPDGLFAVRLPLDASRVVTASGLARCGPGGEQYIFTATGRPALLTVPLSFEAGAREWLIKIAAVYPFTAPQDGPPFRCAFAGCLPMTQNRSIARVPASLPSGCPFSERTGRALVMSTYIMIAAAAAALLARVAARRDRARHVFAATDVPPAAWPAQAGTPRARRGSPPLAAGDSASSVGAASTVTLTPPTDSRRRVNFDDSGRRYLVSSIGGTPSAVEVTAGRSDRVQQALDDVLAGVPAARSDHYVVVAGVCAPLVAVARLDE